MPIESIVYINEASNLTIIAITIKFPSFDSVSYGSVLGLYINIHPIDPSTNYGLIIFLSLSTSLVVMIGFIASIVHCKRERARRLYELVK
jgi:hypothetical protein